MRPLRRTRGCVGRGRVNAPASVHRWGCRAVTDRLVIALDAMGGDRAPGVVVAGAALAHERFPDVEFLMFGDEGALQSLLDPHPALAKVSTLCHTPYVVRNEDKPSTALRQARNSSLRLAIAAVQDGTASGVVAAGNTGHLMAIAKFVLKTPPGSPRPANAPLSP